MIPLLFPCDLNDCCLIYLVDLNDNIRKGKLHFVEEGISTSCPACESPIIVNKGKWVYDSSRKKE